MEIIMIGLAIFMPILFCILEIIFSGSGKRRRERKKLQREQIPQYCKKCELDVVPKTLKRIGVNRYERQYCPHCNYQLNREYNNIYCIIFLVIMFSQLFLIF